MKLSMNIIADQLRTWNFSISHNGKESDMIYYGIFLMNKNAIFSSDYLLLGSESDFSTLHLEDHAIICLGELSSYLKENNTWICLPARLNIMEIYFILQQAYIKYEDWSQALKEELDGDTDLTRLCELSIGVFNNPILIHDANSILLANVYELPGQYQWNYDDETGVGQLHMETLNAFKADSEYQSTLMTRTAEMFSENMFGYRILYINFWNEDRFMGRMCISELGRKITDGDYQLTEYLADIIMIAFRKGNIFTSQGSRELEMSFKELMDYGNTNENLLSKRLDFCGWDKNHKYTCVCLKTDAHGMRSFSVDYICNQVEMLFRNTCAFHYDKYIVVVVNETLIADDLQIFLSDFAIFLREGLYRAGISDTINEIRTLPYLYTQSKAALIEGERVNEQLWLYHFKDYKIPYFFSLLTKELPPDMLCDKSLLTLREYDAKHGTDFLQTLKVYLRNDRNLTKTASILFIHRTTLLYRIERIETLTKLDLEDENVRFIILTSFVILELEKLNFFKNNT